MLLMVTVVYVIFVGKKHEKNSLIPIVRLDKSEDLAYGFRIPLSSLKSWNKTLETCFTI